MAVNVLEFSDADFQAQVLDASEPVLVDFWAPWCGPCRMIAPTIEELAAEYAGKVRVGKVNTDECPKTATAYKISAIPTVMLFKNGQVVKTLMGVNSKDKFAAVLNSHLG